MSEQLGGLLEQLDGDPDDRDTQLVLADHLIAAGDPRGELIALDHADRTTPGGLAEADAVERILLLAAMYGFPSAHNTAYPMLPFAPYNRDPGDGAIVLDHGGHQYLLWFNRGNLRVDIDGAWVTHGTGPPAGDFYFDTEDDYSLTEQELATILAIINDALQAGTPLESLRFPYDGHPLPQYPGVPLRIYELPADYRERYGKIHRQTYGLTARDYFRWHALWDRLRGIHYRARK